MSKARFIALLVAVMCAIAGFQVLISEAMVYQVMRPTFKDTIDMLTLPGPVVIVFLASFYFLVYLYLRPILKFLDLVRDGKSPGEKFAAAIQDRAVTFPYFMALLAYPFYMVGSSVATWIICRKAGWPYESVGYGFLGGLFCSLLATPMAIYGYSWVVRPVLELSLKVVPSLPRSRTAGQKITVMLKLIITVLSLMTAAVGFILVVSYRQTTLMLDNTREMEQMLTPEQRAGLLQSHERTVESGVKSSLYFHRQLGNLVIFYSSIMAVAILVSLLLAVAAAMDITRPLRILKAGALKVQAGDYGEQIQMVSNDELAELGSAFNSMMLTISGQLRSMEQVVDNLKHGIRQIDETVNTVVSVSGQQSQGATDQASALEQASSIATEIAYTAREIENRAKTLGEVAEASRGFSQDGRQKLERAKEEFADINQQMDAIQAAMAQLEARFRETYTIVELIKDMAEKTEILSLNASIEAAAAGMEGKRFMVVAEETRNLSTRSSSAVRQIKELVASIQKATVDSISVSEHGKAKVMLGARTIEAALESLKDIAASAETAFTVVKEITGATAQQTKASEQLADSVSHIYGVSRDVAKGAGEVNSAITTLKNFAESLRKIVQQKTEE
jgi:methyl-accepting chemotaxis protein